MYKHMIFPQIDAGNLFNRIGQNLTKSKHITYKKYKNLFIVSIKKHLPLHLKSILF